MLPVAGPWGARAAAPPPPPPPPPPADRAEPGAAQASGLRRSHHPASAGSLRVLLVEDEGDHALIVKRFLRHGFPEVQVSHARTLAQARSSLATDSHDLLLCDLGLPDGGGTKTVESLMGEQPSAPLVVLTCNGEEQTAVEALRLGAQDYLSKEALTAKLLRKAILYALERQALQRNLRALAHFDSLTGLLRREAFHHELARTLKRLQRHGGSVALLFVDLDRFKEVNDGFGHEAGDQFLVAVAERLRRSVRDCDSVGRLGGDEFAVLLEQPRPEEVEGVAVRILSHVREPIRVGDTELRPAASIGIAFPGSDEEKPESLLGRADTAMYGAKQTGGDRFRFFDRQLEGRQRQRAHSHGLLRAAILSDELNVYYQPVLSMDAGRVVAAEALLRWSHPTRGAVGPGELGDEVESPRLLSGVGDGVLRQVCQHLAATHPARRVPIWVNVDRAQFETADFVGRVEALLDAHHLPPRLLSLEVTERLLVGDARRARRVLEDLAALGVGVAIDRFGAGFSSLRELRQLPLACLKIDRGFIGQRPGHEIDRPIVRAVVQLGRALSCRVVATAVEHEHQLEAARSLGCDAWQGFLHSRPVSWPEWQDRLQAP